MMHRLIDPDAGDALTVVTALPPPRGFIRRQDFVEFSLLESLHGVVIEPKSDDVTVETATDTVMLTRPGGLTLSPAKPAGSAPPSAGAAVLRHRAVVEGSGRPFHRALDARIDAASHATGDDRVPARLDLARFYMARGMYPEAKGVLDLAHARRQAGQEDPATMIGHAAASALMGRPEQTLKDVANPAIASDLRCAGVEGRGAGAAGQMAGGAREVQERAVRDHRAAARHAARGAADRDARLARGQGLFRRRQLAAAISNWSACRRR